MDTLAEDISRLASTLFFGYYQLWYIPGIIGGGAMLLLLKRLSPKSLFGVAMFLFLVATVIQYVSNYHLVSDPQIDALLNEKLLYRNFFFMGFPLFAMGYLMRILEIPQKLGVPFIRAMAVVGLVVLLGESYFNSQRVPETEKSGRLHTSAVTVAVLPEAEEVARLLLPRGAQARDEARVAAGRLPPAVGGLRDDQRRRALRRER